MAVGAGVGAGDGVGDGAGRRRAEAGDAPNPATHSATSAMLESRRIIERLGSPCSARLRRAISLDGALRDTVSHAFGKLSQAPWGTAEHSIVQSRNHQLLREARLLRDEHYDETLDGADGLVDGALESRIGRAFSRAMLRANVRRAIRMGILYVGAHGICRPLKLSSARSILEAERRENGFVPSLDEAYANAAALVLVRRLNWGILRGWLTVAPEHAVRD